MEYKVDGAIMLLDYEQEIRNALLDFIDDNKDAFDCISTEKLITEFCTHKGKITQLREKVEAKWTKEND